MNGHILKGKNKITISKNNTYFDMNKFKFKFVFKNILLLIIQFDFSSGIKVYCNELK